MNHIDLWVDCQKRRLVKSSGAYESEAPVFVRGDDLELRVRFVDVDRATNDFTVTPRAFPSGSQFTFTGKSAYDGAALVFADVDKWTPPAQSGGYYTCTVNFADPNLLTAIGSAATLAMHYDIAVADPDGSKTTLLKLDAQLENDVHRGNENVGEAAPTYVTAAALLARLPASVTFEELPDGRLQLLHNGEPVHTYG